MGNKVISRVGPKLGIYEEDNDAQLSASLGQVRELDDGRKFRLCKNGTVALVAGVLTQSPVQDGYDDALVVNTAAAIGDKEIEVTTTSGHGGYDANALKDGYLVVNLGSGDIGTFYKIKSNDAMVSTVTATITLYDGLTTVLAATTNEVSICANPYSGVVLDANSAPLVGVPLIAVTAAYYFWAQFDGIGPATATAAAIGAGDYLLHSAGDVYVSASTDADTEMQVAMAYTAAASGDALIVRWLAIG